MADDQKQKKQPGIKLAIVANRNTIHPVSRDMLPEGYLLASMIVRDEDDAAFIRAKLGWSHFSVLIGSDHPAGKGPAKVPNAQRIKEQEARKAAAEAEAEAKRLADERRQAAEAQAQADAQHAQARAAAFDALVQVSGIGPATAAALIDIEITSLDELLRVAGTDEGRQRIIDIDGVGPNELANWLEQIPDLLNQQANAGGAQGEAGTPPAY